VLSTTISETTTSEANTTEQISSYNGAATQSDSSMIPHGMSEIQPTPATSTYTAAAGATAKSNGLSPPSKFQTSVLIQCACIIKLIGMLL